MALRAKVYQISVKPGNFPIWAGGKTVNQLSAGEDSVQQNKPYKEPDWQMITPLNKQIVEWMLGRTPRLSDNKMVRQLDDRS